MSFAISMCGPLEPPGFGGGGGDFVSLVLVGVTGGGCGGGTTGLMLRLLAETNMLPVLRLSPKVMLSNIPP
jgi:hypothetical protein